MEMNVSQKYFEFCIFFFFVTSKKKTKEAQNKPLQKKLWSKFNFKKLWKQMCFPYLNVFCAMRPFQNQATQNVPHFETI